MTQINKKNKNRALLQFLQFLKLAIDIDDTNWSEKLYRGTEKSSKKTLEQRELETVFSDPDY
jgi:hypothetical protein